MSGGATRSPGRPRIVVIGGGIAGLAVAHALRAQGAETRGVEVVVLEQSARAGGNIRTDVIDGFTCEWGPNGFLDNAPATLALIDELGLRSRLQPSSDRARRRFIWRRGRLHALPGGPVEFLTSGLLSWQAKARLAMEPFAARRPEGDETIHAFATRRIGREAADVLIDSMVSGVFGGEARALSLRACFPKMWHLETDHGGLFRAMIARRRKHPRRNGEAMGSPLGRLTSFVGGSEDLVRGLATSLGAIVRTGVSVRAVARDDQGYAVSIEGETPLRADVVVMASGAGSTARLVRALDPPLAETLQAIPTATMVVACVGFREDQLPAPLDGFGFLVPRSEGIRTLGVLWDSSVYPGRAPKGQVLMRAMLGGATDPGAIDLTDEAITDVVRGDLRRIMGIEATPIFGKVFRHALGIPQYTVGHLARLEAAEDRLTRFEGLLLAGNAYRGVAINSCIADAASVAARALKVVDDGLGRPTSTTAGSARIA